MDKSKRNCGHHILQSTGRYDFEYVCIGYLYVYGKDTDEPNHYKSCEENKAKGLCNWYPNRYLIHQELEAMAVERIMTKRS